MFSRLIAPLRLIACGDTKSCHLQLLTWSEAHDGFASLGTIDTKRGTFTQSSDGKTRGSWKPCRVPDSDALFALRTPKVIMAFYERKHVPWYLRFSFVAKVRVISRVTGTVTECFLKPTRVDSSLDEHGRQAQSV